MNSKKKMQESVAIVMLISFASLIVFRKYIFEGYYLMSQGALSDIIRANLPTYYQFFDGLFVEHNFWSWKMGIGMSMFTHGDVYFDPFVYVLFIFGRDKIPDMLIWMMLIKLLAEGLTMSMYLRYFKLNSFAIILASSMYAFSGYSLIMGSNFALGTILVYVPIVCLGIEKWLDENKKGILLSGLFLTCICSYYFFFSLGLLIVVYLIVRAKQKKIKIMPKLFSLALIALCVIGLSLFSFLPQIELVLSSDRVAGAKDVNTGIQLFIPQMEVLATAFLRSLSNDILGNRLYSQYLGYAYNEACDYFQISTYISSSFVLLVGQLWNNKKEERKNICFTFALAIAFILIPFTAFAFNAFSTINARWMFFLSFLQAIVVAVAMDSVIEFKNVNLKVLLRSILVNYIFLIVSMWIVSQKNYSLDLGDCLYSGRKYILYLTLFWICIVVLVFLFRVIANKAKLSKWFLIVSCVCLFVLDVSINYYYWYASEKSVCEYTEEERCNYFDSSAEIIKNLMSEDTSWYRIHKNFDSVYDENNIPSENDAMVQKYYGLKSYNSINNPNYSAFLKELNIYVAIPGTIEHLQNAGISPKEVTGPQLNYINGTYERYNIMSYLGVKYYLCEQEMKDLPEYLKLVDCKENIWIYENILNLPLAFVHENTIGMNQFKDLNDDDKEMALFKYTVIDTEDIENVELSNININESVRQKQEAFELKKFHQDLVEFKINVSKDGYLNLTIPYDSNWHIYIDGQEVKTEKVNIGLLGCKITSGEHEVAVKYVPKPFLLGVILSSVMFLLVILYSKLKKDILINIENSALKMEEVLKKNSFNIIRLLKYLIWIMISALIALGGLYCVLYYAGRGFSLSVKRALFFIGEFVLIYFGGAFFSKKIFNENLDLKTRGTNIELCRIISMLLIIAHNCVVHGGSFQMEGMGNNRIISLMILSAGKIGFACFMAISCWHLVDQKFKMQRFLRIWLETLFYSIILAVPALVINGQFTIRNLFPAFLPINGNSHGYAAGYMAFYLLLPYIAKMTDGLSKFAARWLMCLLLYLEVFSQVLGVINKYRQPFASEIFVFVLCYVIALNLKKYPLRITENKTLLSLIVIGIWGILFVYRYLYALYPEKPMALFMVQTMYDESSITSIVAGFALFFLFKNINMKYNPVVNYLSLSTLGILLLHDHNYFRDILWKNMLNAEAWYYEDYFIILLFAVVFLIYCMCMIIDRIRAEYLEKKIFKMQWAVKICEFFDKKIENSK